jgi:hypothetical protein
MRDQTWLGSRISNLLAAKTCVATDQYLIEPLKWSNHELSVELERIL